MPGTSRPQMQDLLAERDFVRGLARQLVRGDDADDLAQDTWVAALAGRPADLRQPRSWLARVASRLASNRRRAERRRVEREHGAAAEAAATGPRAAPSTDEILACEQVRQRVVAAVLALDEPFRATVLARFYECLGTAAIAARDHVPEATVRSRLKRGLDRLRARLDGEHGGVRSAWAGPLALLGREPASPALPFGPAATTTSTKPAVAVVAAVALAGLTLWGAGAFAPDAAAPRLPPSGPSRAIVAHDTNEHTNAAGDRTAPRGAPRGERAHEPGQPLPFPITDEPIDAVPVRVLDAATRRPVAGAEVRFVPFQVDFAHPTTRGDQALHEISGSETFLARFGSCVQTDETGAATVRVPRSGAEVVASRGDRRVRAHVDPTRLARDQHVLLALAPERTARVRVVDAASGAPLPGMLLELSWTTDRPVVGHGEAREAMVGPADEHGLVAIRLSDTQRRVRVRPWTAGAGAEVVLDLPAALERVTPIPCAATGSMTVELRTPSGAPWPEVVQARISAGDGTASPSLGPVTWRAAEPGVYRVPHVALGRTWTVVAASARTGEGKATSVVAGPRSPGEHVRVVLRAPDEPCIVWARFRTPDGALPAPSLRAMVRQGSGDAERIGTIGYLDTDGRLGWLVDPKLPARGRVELDGQRATAGECDWQLAAAAPGAHELGTLTVVPAPLVVAGCVASGDERAPWPVLQLLIETPSAGQSWRPWRQVELRTADGSFEIRGRCGAARVRVSVRGDAHCLGGDAVIVDVGATDVRLRVARGAALRARVLAPAAHAPSLTLRASPSDGTPLPGVATPTTWEPPSSRNDASLVDFDGSVSTFAWPPLPAGSYRVDVLAPGVAQPLARLDGVRVGGGAPPDPRLDPIDVRSCARTLTVSLVPLPAGPRPVTDGGVLATPSGAAADTLHGLLFDARGEARLWVGPDPVDVLVAVPGFRLWRAAGVTADAVTVALEPPLELSARLAPALAARLAGHRVRVELDPAPPRDGSADVRFVRAGEREPAAATRLHWLQRLAGTGSATLADARGTGVVPLAGAGRFSVRLAIETRKGDVDVNESWLEWQRNPVLPPTVTVSGAGDPVLVVDVEPAVLDRVVAELVRMR